MPQHFLKIVFFFVLLEGILCYVTEMSAPADWTSHWTFSEEPFSSSTAAALTDPPLATTTTTKNIPCKDRSPSFCMRNSFLCAFTPTEVIMHDECARTCLLCDPDCQDNLLLCPLMAAGGACGDRTTRLECSRSCNEC